MATEATISFGLIDVTAKQDTTASITDKQSFIDPQDLALEGVYAPKVGTFEHNYFVLDGTYKLFPDNPENYTWGIWSESKSGADGSFEVPPVLTLTFTEQHSSKGLVIEFNPYGNNYCNNLNIKWYNGSTLLYNEDFTPDKWKYCCEKTVTDYNKVVITFNSTNIPYRFLKIQNIQHGIVKDFGSDEIKSADLLEDIDLSGLTLPANTLDFTVYSKDDNFNIFNPQGIYTLLQKKQQLSLTGRKNGTEYNLGTFYVDEIEMQSDKLLNITAQDGIGVMDGTYFKGGIYTNKNAGDLIDELMTEAGFGYTIESSLSDKTITGYLPIMSHKEALQHISFAIGGYVSTARSGTINIKAFPDLSTEAVTVLGRERKFTGTTVKMRELVTGVDVTYHSYTKSTEAKEIKKVTLAVGTNTITFDNPVADITVSNGTLTESGANYCVITATSEDECTIFGKEYNDTTDIVSVRMAQLPAGDKENIIAADSTLLNVYNAKEAAQRLYDYYQYRIEQSLKLVINGDETVGQIADVETEYGVYRGSIIENMDINLCGGFVTKVVTVGE